MKGTYKITILLLAILTITACSRKRDSFMGRNFHAVTAEFNTMYNGDLAFIAGEQGLAESYRDNYWEVLPVERFQKEEDYSKPGDQKDPNFERAEEKAVKAIQKHSIYVNGKEYNPQIDEAYIMLGKARYFDSRFVPALDAFNFILNRYPTSNSINRANIWKAKCNIRLNNEELAIEELDKILEDVEQGEVDMDDDEYADTNAIMAEAHIVRDSLHLALPYIKEASTFAKNKELKGRYTYIKGQLYDRLEEKDSANIAYQEVIDMNRKIPRIYHINAYIAQGKNFDYEGGDRTAFLELLFDMEENRENRPFLDKIYNQIGDYYRNIGINDTATIYYNKSIKAFKEDNILQSVNYGTLAEMNFDNAEYKAAGKYYDSTLTFLVEKSKRWRRIKKKRDNLDDVIKYEDIATLNDSIIRIATMTEDQQLAFFTEYTDGLKEQRRLDSIALIKEEAKIANQEFFTKGNKEGGSNFYFYNQTSLAYGKQEFRRIWGDRKLEDFWRLSEKKSTPAGLTIGGDNTEKVESATNKELLDPQYYIAKIPKRQGQIDTLTIDRDFAYYQLGLIYKEKFKEPSLAVERLEKLLSYNPDERLILPAMYTLHKSYVELENEAKADEYKNRIVSGYPESRYAEILLNPNTALSTDESSPDFKYKKLYEAFEAYQYDEVIAKCDEYIDLYFGDAIVPKFEMLKATALGRRDGFAAYDKALKELMVNYPNKEEGKQARNIVSTVLPGLKPKKFVGDNESDKWKIVYTFSNSETEAADALVAKLQEIINYYNYFKMSASRDYYTPDTQFVVLHGLGTRLGGRDLAEAFSENKKYSIKKPFFEISTPNYKTVQIHKNLEEYLNQGGTKEDKNNPQK